MKASKKNFIKSNEVDIASRTKGKVNFNKKDEYNIPLFEEECHPYAIEPVIENDDIYVADYYGMEKEDLFYYVRQFQNVWGRIPKKDRRKISAYWRRARNHAPNGQSPAQVLIHVIKEENASAGCFGMQPPDSDKIFYAICLSSPRDLSMLDEDVCMIIAHELAHILQIAGDPGFRLSADYSKGKYLTSKEEIFADEHLEKWGFNSSYSDFHYAACPEFSQKKDTERKKNDSDFIKELTGYLIENNKHGEAMEILNRLVAKMEKEGKGEIDGHELIRMIHKKKRPI